MPLFYFKKIIKSFSYAGRGLLVAIRNETSFRIHVLAMVVVLILAAVFEVSIIESALLILVIVLVLILEILNTTLEKILDVLEPRFLPHIQDIKDLSAAAVLISTLGAILIGILIFAPRFLNLFF